MSCHIEGPIVEAPFFTMSFIEVAAFVFMALTVMGFMAILTLMRRTEATLWWCMDRADKASNKLEMVEVRSMRANYRGHELIRSREPLN
jgi:hypothetical protein